MSKGSNPRPFEIPQEEYASNHERIFGAPKARERYIPPATPGEKAPPVRDMYKDPPCKACDGWGWVGTSSMAASAPDCVKCGGSGWELPGQ